MTYGTKLESLHKALNRLGDRTQKALDARNANPTAENEEALTAARAAQRRAESRLNRTLRA